LTISASFLKTLQASNPTQADFEVAFAAAVEKYSVTQTYTSVSERFSTTAYTPFSSWEHFLC